MGLTGFRRSVTPVRWYRFADGYLGLTADDGEFADRFHRVYAECTSVAPPDGSAVSLRCHVGTAPRRPTVTLDFDPPQADATLARLLGDQTRTGALRPDATCAGGRVTAARDGPWQWLFGHLAVTAVLALQPEFMFFHAAAVAIGDRGVLLMGERASGKTSVSLALASRGHTFLSDEVGALRLATGELVPLRRAPLVRVNAGAGAEEDERLPVSVSDAFPVPRARPVSLRAVIRLRRFAATTRLEPLSLRAGNLDALTPLACSVTGPGTGRRMVRLLALLADVPAYALDAASPEEAASFIERTLSA